MLQGRRDLHSVKIISGLTWCFYNRLLRCFVLFDLKIGKLKHQDLGQMQMYVNYYDRYEKQEDENPTIGVLFVPG